jgi:hypothetical protein
MNRNHQNPLPPMRIPEITDEDRAAGFKDWEITLRDRLVEKVRIYTLDAKRFRAGTRDKTVTKYLSEVIASSLRKDEGYVEQILGVSGAEIFLITHRLYSEELFESTFKARKGFFAEVFNEKFSGPGSPSAN